MRKFFAVTVSFAFISVCAAAFSGCSSQPNANANANPAASAEPTPDKPAIEAQLKALEFDWPRIIKERDGAAVRKVEADDIVLIYPDGTDGTKEEDIKDIEAGTLANDPQEISDVVVTVIDNDSAVVRSRTRVKGDNYKISDGKCETIIHEFRTLDTFARRNGQWQIVASATVPVRSPLPSATPSETAGSAASPKPTSGTKAPAATRPSPQKSAPPKSTPE